MKSQGRVPGPVGLLLASSRIDWKYLKKSLGTSRMAVKSLGRVSGPKKRCEVSRKSLGTSRIDWKYLKRVWGPAG